MANAVKLLSIFTVLFVFFLVFSEIPEIDAQDSECLKEYGGDVGFGFCAPKIFPTFCYMRCLADKGAKGGKCRWGEGGTVKCLCDFCSDSTFLIKL